MVEVKRITCYTDSDGCPISGEEYIGFRPVHEERIGWYRCNNTYESECKTSYMNKEELAEYLKKFNK